MKAYEWIIISIIFSLATGAMWYFTGKPVNATLSYIGMGIWGFIQIIIEYFFPKLKEN